MLIKRTAERSVSAEDSLRYFTFEAASESEREALLDEARKKPVTKIVDRLLGRRAVAAHRIRKAMGAHIFNPYSQKPSRMASESITKLTTDALNIGRTACQEGCDLCMQITYSSYLKAPTWITLKCDKPACRETGFSTADSHITSELARVKAINLEFNDQIVADQK